MKLSSCLFCVLMALSSLAQAGIQYDGEWAYQALNSGDTSFKVEHENDSLTFYRVLHPEFQGERYKLEHIYRGRVAGSKISGKMFVREEGMAEFEFLRPFKGRIISSEKMVMDDMNLKRLVRVAAAEPVAEPKPAAEPEPSAPRYSKVIINRRDKPDSKPTKPTQPTNPTKQNDTPKVATATPKDTSPKATKAAPFKIPNMIPVGRNIKTNIGKKVRGLLEEGDSLYGKREYKNAIEKFSLALELNPHKVEVLYKLGLGHGILGSKAAKKDEVRIAADHYKRAIGYWSRAYRFDPYNKGSAENIKRAKTKLAKLKAMGR